MSSGTSSTGGQALSVVQPDWPAPPHVRAVVTTRMGGLSSAPYDGFNLALHVGDSRQRVLQNRLLLSQHLDLPVEPAWLNQVHGARVISTQERGDLNADAAFSDRQNQPCVVLVADCLPIFICDRTGRRVAVLHAGWRGLAEGVIAATVARFLPEDDLIAWLGPAIGPCHYEVGAEVKDAFRSEAERFAPSDKPDRWLFDLYGVARKQLADNGVGEAFGGDFCTYCESARFFSYRRDGATGRIAALIWLDDNSSLYHE
jgi:YfiH family protein